MAPNPINEYRLSPAAKSDLDGIWDYMAATYVRGLGETLTMLVRHPEMARERKEIDPPVRLHPYRSHLIIYRVESEYLTVIRIVHARQHWQVLLDD